MRKLDSVGLRNLPKVNLRINVQDTLIECALIELAGVTLVLEELPCTG